MSRDFGAYFTLVALVLLLFFLTTQDHRLRSSASAIFDATEVHPRSNVDDFTDLEQRLSRFRQKTGYVIKLVEIYGVAAPKSDPFRLAPRLDMSDVATNQFEQLQKENPKSKGIVVVLLGTASDGAAVKTSESLRSRFARQDVERKITAILQGSRASKPELIVHVLLEHLDLWFYLLDASKTRMFLVRSPTGEMILLVFAPVLGLLTGIFSIAFMPIRYLRRWSRFWICGVLGVCVATVFALIVRQRGGIYPGMFAYALGTEFIVSGMVGLLQRFWLYETFKGRRSGGWWNGPVHFHNG